MTIEKQYLSTAKELSNQRMLIPLLSFLEKSISFADRLICLRILDSEEYYRLIITKSKFSNFDLTNIKEKIEKKLDEKEEIEKENIKIIDKDKLEIKISASNLEDFLSNIKKIIINEKVS